MRQWQLDNRELHTFVNDMGFGIVVPLQASEAARPELLETLGKFGPSISEQVSTLCAYAAAFQEAAPGASQNIEFQLKTTRVAMKHRAEAASEMSQRLQRGLSDELP